MPCFSCAARAKDRSLNWRRGATMVAISSEIRRLAKKWDSNAGWPKRLEWLEVDGVRGWKGQRVEFSFPIVALVGENGSGKSTLLQAAACAYKPDGQGRTRV